MRRPTTLVLLALLAGAGCTKKAEADLVKATSDLEACRTELASLRSQVSGEQTARQLAEKRLAAYREIAERFRAAFGAEGIELLLRNGRLVVQLPTSILFDSGKTSLKPSGKATLDKLAGVLQTVGDRQFLVAGHTDDVPVKEANERFRTNWELSVLRATEAVQYLQGKGVTPKQLGAAGYGQYMPDKPNDTDAGKAENRRLEIIVLPTLDEIPALPASL